MLEIPKGYYLSSISELKIDGWLYRTEGFKQTQLWSDSLVKPFKDCIDYRRYFRGMHKNKKFFAKQYLEPAHPFESIEDSVEYHFQNLLFLKDTGCTPKPLFLTHDTVGMEYIEGRTIKNLVLENKLTIELARKIVDSLETNGKAIIRDLGSMGRRYDCSDNNILVREHCFSDGEIVFIDFDPAIKGNAINNVIKKIWSLAR